MRHHDILPQVGFFLAGTILLGGVCVALKLCADFSLIIFGAIVFLGGIGGIMLGRWRATLKQCVKELEERDRSQQKEAEAALQRAHEEMEKRVNTRTARLIGAYERLTAMHEVTRTITAPLQLDVVLDTIVHSTVNLLGTDTAVILLLDEASKTLSIKSAVGLSEHVIKQTHDKVGQSLAGRVVQQGKPIIANDLPNDPRFENPSAHNEGLLACASVPLRVGRKIIGTLDVHSKTNRWAFNDNHIQMLEMLASQAAIAIEHAHLYEGLQKAHDELEARVEERTAELVREIAKRNRFEEELAKERNLLRAIIDILPDRIYVKDPEARFINANRTIVQIMGARALDDLIGKTDFDFYPQKLAEQYYADDQAVIKSGEPLINREEPNIEQNTGLKKWILTTKTPFWDSQGNIIGLVGIGRDITDRRRAQDALQQRNLELAMLNEMSGMLQMCHTEQETYKVMTRVCEQLFPEDSGSLHILDVSRVMLRTVACWGASPPHFQTLQAGECYAFQRDQLYRTESSPSVTSCQPIRSFPEYACLCAPLSVPGNTLGVLHLRLGKQTIDYPQKEWEQVIDAKQIILKRIAEHYALFLVNLRLRETLRIESIHDPLTGLFNRRHMEASLEREAHRARRLNTRLGIIMIDIDHFKQFNDTHGHEAGDLVLQAIGNFLLKSTRGEDIACRYGGEEFLVILAGTSPEAVAKRAEELWYKARDLTVAYQGKILSFTISVGVALLPDHGAEVKDVVKAADKALYQAKAAGRDRVVMASPPTAGEI